jgi:hypothetical protein
VTEKKPHPRKLQPPRYAVIKGPIHVRYTLDGLNRIARELNRERERLVRTGRNFEERAEWAATWSEFVRQTRKKGN